MSYNVAVSQVVYDSYTKCIECAKQKVTSGKICKLHFDAFLASETCSGCGARTERQKPSADYPEGRVMTQCVKCHTEQMRRVTPTSPKASPAQFPKAPAQIMCKNGKNCTYPHCIFVHPEGYVPTALSQVPCRHGKDCTYPGCMFAHPDGRVATHDSSAPKRTVCKYDEYPGGCKNQKCTFDHPSRSAPRQVTEEHEESEKSDDHKDIKTPSPSVEKHSPVIDEEQYSQ